MAIISLEFLVSSKHLILTTGQMHWRFMDLLGQSHIFVISSKLLGTVLDIPSISVRFDQEVWLLMPMST
jgi:hypothetical protein